MNETDEDRPHYGRMPGVHPRAMKRIFLADKFAIDGDSATQRINTGHVMILYEQFVDSLPDVVCYEGEAGLERAFKEWLVEKGR